MNKSLKGFKTAENLMKAFAGESQAKNRYTFYAEKAKQEKFIEISQVFLETAHNEQFHAERFFRFLNNDFKGEQIAITNAGYPIALGSTLENLEAGADGEYEEWAELYPSFSDVAMKEGFEEIASVFSYIAEVEKRHYERFKNHSQILVNNAVFKKANTVYWICLECGHIHEGIEAPQVCPVCSRPQGFFKLYQ
ncbi:MAG: rubrerythrin [Eubacteriales bacterium]